MSYDDKDEEATTDLVSRWMFGNNKRPFYNTYELLMRRAIAKRDQPSRMESKDLQPESSKDEIIAEALKYINDRTQYEVQRNIIEIINKPGPQQLDLIAAVLGFGPFEGRYGKENVIKKIKAAGPQQLREVVKALWNEILVETDKEWHVYRAFADLGQ